MAKKKKQPKPLYFHFLVPVLAAILKKTVELVKRTSHGQERDTPSPSHWLILQGTELPQRKDNAACVQ